MNNGLQQSANSESPHHDSTQLQLLLRNSFDLYRMKSFGCLLCPVSRHLPIFSEYHKGVATFGITSSSLAAYFFRHLVFAQDKSPGIVPIDRVSISMSEFV